MDGEKQNDIGRRDFVALSVAAGHRRHGRDGGGRR